ncbi:MAG: hypothetical protein WCG19_10130 [Chlorobiaceae bacterium]
MKLDKYNIETLIDSVSKGMTREMAYLSINISRSTFYEWFNQGRKDDEKEVDSLQRQLYIGLPQAEAQFELRHLKNITAAANKNWRVSAWYLERTRPSRYGRRPPEPKENGGDRIIEIG